MKKKIAITLLFATALLICSITEANPYSKATTYNFETAKCTNGITDIYIVNSEWICVVNDYMSNYWADIVETDKWTFASGITNRYAQIYTNYLNGGPEWEYRLKVLDMHDYWMPVVRPEYDTNLNNVSFFNIISSDDPNYFSSRKPLAAGRFINSVRQWVDPQSKNFIDSLCHNVNFSWLKLPFNLSNNCSYSVSLGNGFSGNFLYSENKTISRAIHINQLGYLGWAPEKYAYIGAWAGSLGPIEFPDLTNRFFGLIEAISTNQVFSAPISLRYNPNSVPNDYIGEFVYELDFSDFSQTGSFFISVPGVGRSWPFKINDDIYGEAFYITMKGLYQHRAGFEVTSNRLMWARKAGHKKNYRSHCTHADLEWKKADSVIGTGDIDYFGQARSEMWKLRFCAGAESNFPDFFKDPNKNSEWSEKLDAASLISNCFGGWYDAGDYDRRPYHLQSVFDLVSAYIINSNALVDNTCNMLESGNGIPDILDECAWLLRIYRTSQRKDGGVSVRFEAKSHPTGYIFPAEDKMLYFASYPDRYGSLMYSAAAALFAWAVKPFDSALANDYFISASNAFAFSENVSNRIRNISYWDPGSEPIWNPTINSLFQNNAPTMLSYHESKSDPYVWTDFARGDKFSSPKRVYRLKEFRYDEKENFFPESNIWNRSPWRWRAPFCLFLASNGNTYYSDQVNFLYSEMHHLREDTYINANFLVAFTNPSEIDSSIRNSCKNDLISRADSYLTEIAANPYRQIFDTPGSWGGSTLQKYSKHLLTTFNITGNSNYLSGALLVNDFMLGCRPMGFVFTTGLGWNYTTSLLHLFSIVDGVIEPSPGIAMYAPVGNSTYEWRLRGYSLKYSSSFSRMHYPGSKNVAVSFLPPPFDSPGQSQNENIPVWRNFQSFEGRANICEYTVWETIAHQVFGYGGFVNKGWFPDSSLKNRKPKPKNELYGFYWMP